MRSCQATSHSGIWNPLVVWTSQLTNLQNWQRSSPCWRLCRVVHPPVPPARAGAPHKLLLPSLSGLPRTSATPLGSPASMHLAPNPSLLPTLLRLNIRLTPTGTLRIQKAILPARSGDTAAVFANFPQQRAFFRPLTFAQQSQLHSRCSQLSASYSTMSSATTFYDFEPVDSTSF